MPSKILLLFAVILSTFACQQQPKGNVERFFVKNGYAPPKQLTYTLQNDEIIVSFPPEVRSEKRYISFLMKDSISGKYNNIHGEFKLKNNQARIPLQEDDYSNWNYELFGFATWDNDLWVLGCCQIVRFIYIDDHQGTLNYDQTCARKYRVFNYKRFEQEANPIEQLQFGEILKKHFACGH